MACSGLFGILLNVEGSLTVLLHVGRCGGDGVEAAGHAARDSAFKKDDRDFWQGGFGEGRTALHFDNRKVVLGQKHELLGARKSMCMSARWLKDFKIQDQRTETFQPKWPFFEMSTICSANTRCERRALSFREKETSVFANIVFGNASNCPQRQAQHFIDGDWFFRKHFEYRSQKNKHHFDERGFWK
jgi:hypothetical protein